MIFSELYSAYFNAVAAILSEVIQGKNDERVLKEAVMRHAFSESVLTVLPALKSGKWQLLRKDMTTPIQNLPTMPLTLLEKRWLKAISFDPRVRLFDLSFEGLEDIEPLFTPEDYEVYDRYADGDPYFDEGYATRFRRILEAVRERQPLKIEMIDRRGRRIRTKIFPLRLEYSERDDKFRLVCAGRIVNLARILTCERCAGNSEKPVKSLVSRTQTVTLKICDERNTLERSLLYFAHFEKRAERLDERHYLLYINYDKGDETEMVIGILQYGPYIEVIKPMNFRNLIIERLKKQQNCELC